MPSKVRRVPSTFTIPSDLLDRIEHHADQAGISRSEFVVRALEAALPAHQQDPAVEAA